MPMYDKNQYNIVISLQLIKIKKKKKLGDLNFLNYLFVVLLISSQNQAS